MCVIILNDTLLDNGLLSNQCIAKDNSPCYYCLLLFNGLTLCCDFTQEELDPHFTRLTNSSNLRAPTF